MTQTQRTRECDVHGEIKTRCEAFGFRHQLTAERQGFFTLSRRKFRIRVFNLSIMMCEQGLVVSHTFPHLCCTEGVTSAEGIELF